MDGWVCGWDLWVNVQACVHWQGVRPLIWHAPVSWGHDEAWQDSLRATLRILSVHLSSQSLSPPGGAQMPAVQMRCHGCSLPAFGMSLRRTNNSKANKWESKREAGGRAAQKPPMIPTACPERSSWAFGRVFFFHFLVSYKLKAEPKIA